MENKNVKNIKLSTFIICLIVVTIIAIVATAIICNQMVLKTNSQLNLRNEGKDQGQQENGQINMVQNDTPKIDNITLENSIKDEDVKDSANVKTQKVTLNGKECTIKMELSCGEIKEYPEVIFEQGIKVTINGVQCTDIQKTNILTKSKSNIEYKVPQIKTIKSTDNKEYLVLIVQQDTPTSTSHYIYVIGEDSKVLGKIFDYGATSFVIENKNVQNYTINSDSIITYSPETSKTVKQHKYTISNGKLVDSTQTYNNVQSSGATV